MSRREREEELIRSCRLSASALSLQCADVIEAMHAREDKALCVIVRYGMIEGDHHRCWVIDQAARALTAEEYGDFVAAYESVRDEDGSKMYSWDEGIPP